MSRRGVIVAILSGLLAFLFLVPVVHVEPRGTFRCPADGCTFPDYASVTYRALKIGGVWVEHFTLIPMKHYYYAVIL